MPNALTILPVVLLSGCGLLWLVVGVGLLKLKRWAAVTAIVLGAITFAAGTPLIILILVLINWRMFS